MEIDKNWELIIPNILNEGVIKLNGEVSVKCPFHEDQHNSASVNIEKNLFFCQTCQEEGLTLNVLLKRKFNIKNDRLLKQILNSISLSTNKQLTGLIKNSSWDALYERESKKWGFSTKTLKESKVFTDFSQSTSLFSVPYFMENELLGYSTYFGSQAFPKWKISAQTPTGIITPYDLWKNDKRPTLFCAGEKDMLIARSKGYNAISLNGGEMTLPANIEWFKDRVVHIIYDNDETGKKGAKKIAKNLLKVTKNVKIITNIYQILKDNKDDLYDFFTKYSKTADDLDKLILDTPFISKEQLIEEKNKIKLSNFQKNMRNPQTWFKKLRSHVRMATNIAKPQGLVYKLEVHWELYNTRDKTNKKIIHLGNYDQVIEMDYRKNPELMEELLESKNEYSQMMIIRRKGMSYIKKNWEKLVNNDEISKSSLSKTELLSFQVSGSDSKFNILNKDYIQISRYAISPLRETDNEDKNKIDVENNSDDNIVIDAMSINIDEANQNLGEFIGKNLEIVYTLYKHPTTFKIMVVVHEIRNSADFIDNFAITDKVINSLKKFQPNNETTKEKLNKLFKQAKNYMANYLTERMFLINDIVFHSALYYTIEETEKRLPGAIDALLIGDTQSGKSTISKNLIEQYGVGDSIELNAVTETAFKGGQIDSGTKKYITPGLIPRHHRKLLVLEEFQAADKDFIKILREVKHSKRLKIVRVIGELDTSANLRLLTISNPTDGLSLKAFNQQGYKILNKLIKQSPDRSRFDFVALVQQSDWMEATNHSGSLKEFKREDYRNRIRWIWSRGPENIVIKSDVYKEIIRQVKRLNADYNLDKYLPDTDKTHIFGQTLDKKIAKIAIAIAGMLCSSSDNRFLDIKVEKEHIELAVEFLLDLYDSEEFQLLETIEEYKRFSPDSITQKDREWLNAKLNNIDESKGLALRNLFKEITFNKAMLSASLNGLKGEEINAFIYELQIHNFVIMKKDKLIATNKYKALYKELTTKTEFNNKNRKDRLTKKVKRVGGF